MTKVRRSTSEDVISPSPRKVQAPVKSSSKLSTMKRKEEEKSAGPRSKTANSPSKMKFSPKKEPLGSSSTGEKFTPKAGTTPTALKTSPKKPEVS